jgi:hypothetical protein
MSESYNYIKKILDNLTNRQSSGPPPELYPTSKVEYPCKGDTMTDRKRLEEIEDSFIHYPLALHGERMRWLIDTLRKYMDAIEKDNIVDVHRMTDFNLSQYLESKGWERDWSEDEIMYVKGDWTALIYDIDKPGICIVDKYNNPHFDADIISEHDADTVLRCLGIT